MDKLTRLKAATILACDWLVLGALDCAQDDELVSPEADSAVNNKQPGLTINKENLCDDTF